MNRRFYQFFLLINWSRKLLTKKKTKKKKYTILVPIWRTPKRFCDTFSNLNELSIHFFIFRFYLINKFHRLINIWGPFRCLVHQDNLDDMLRMIDQGWLFYFFIIFGEEKSEKLFLSEKIDWTTKAGGKYVLSIYKLVDCIGESK